MSDPKRLAYDLCRSYLHDNQQHLTEADAVKVLGHIRSRDFRWLANVTREASSAFHTAQSLRVCMQIEAFFKKATFFKEETSQDVALEKFLQAERRCRIANRRIDHYDRFPDRLDPHIRGVLERAREWIYSTLGPVSSFIDELPVRCRITSGATAMTSRANSAPFMKLKRRIEAPRRTIPYLRCLADWWGYSDRYFVPVDENRITFVPKNWKTDRTIACEPTGSLPLQLAADSFIKTKLRKRGIDLSSQKKNQHYAKEGSAHDTWATIDLEAASDSLCINAVAYLLPYEWYKTLADFRAPAYRLGDRSGVYAKFSSMGNGATFTLETLIFASLCAAVCSDFCVYGDDIVVPKHAVSSVLSALSFLGFRTNSEKTFTDGPFRESCGVNCYEGVDITPFYLRSWRNTDVDFNHNINSLVAISSPGGHLERDLVRLVKGRPRVQWVPQNDCTYSGIFIDPHTAYSKKILTVDRQGQLSRWIPKFKGIVPKKARYAEVKDSRSLFLWHLNKQRCHLNAHEEMPEHHCVQKYRRKWVRYVPPVTPGGPSGRVNAGRLYSWSALFFAPDKGS